jgi:predicted nucleotidyltransferase
MDCSEVVRRLQEHEKDLHEMGIASLSVFGSVARGEASGKSDVDLLVEFSRPLGLFEFARIRRHLSDILGCQADLVTRDALREEMRDEVLREAVHAA